MAAIELAIDTITREHLQLESLCHQLRVELLAVVEEK